MKNTPFVSVVIPVRNETHNLPRFLSSYAKLRYPKSRRELIIVDGNSTDGTIEIARASGAVVIRNPGRIRSTGCQAGVNASRGEFIAFTDADCVVPGAWIEDLLVHMEKGISAVGGPNITPSGDTPFAKAAGAVVSVLTGPGSRYGYRGEVVTPIYHNPGCNVLYRKTAILDAGGFDPELITCEDEELDYRIRENGRVLLFTPHVIVDHYRRPTYKRFFVQFYRYAVGRMQAIFKHPPMARWFHFVPLVFLVSVILMVSLLTYAGNVWFAIALILSGVGVFAMVCGYLAAQNGYANGFVYAFLFLAWYAGWTTGTVAGVWNGCANTLMRPVSKVRTGMRKIQAVRP